MILNTKPSRHVRVNGRGACTQRICVSACRGGNRCTPRTCISTCREGRACTPCSYISPCRRGRGCRPRSYVSTCREGKGYTPRTCISPCRGSRRCSPRSRLSACRVGIASVPSQVRVSQKHTATASSPKLHSFLSPANLKVPKGWSTMGARRMRAVISMQNHK